MRGPASRLSLRLLACAAPLLAAPALPARSLGASLQADLLAVYGESIRRLDGDQFLEDEPVWLCNLGASAPAEGNAWAIPACALVGRDAAGSAAGSTRART